MRGDQFKDRVVVITGGASGIGAAMGHTFARHGAFVALLDQNGEGAEAEAARIDASGARAMGLACDVTDEAGCQAAIQAVIDRFGGVDVLAANAGITQRSLFVDTETAVYRRVMDVNFFGALHCVRAAIDSLIARKGLIIATESMAGIAPLLGRSGYCASKHAMHGFFTSLRAELRHLGVGVLIVCPGFVQTNLQDRALGGDGEVTRRKQTTLGRPATAEQAAVAIYAAAVRRKPLLVLTAVGKLGYWLSRVAPNLYERIMTRKFRAELTR